ncbi:MAG TPA: helix-turn-helix domain-containing protein, partial [Burkholderiaceae bacterium]|nr:helix-turn-helix domain-containing protein [Burkholderiaceae bacterium]
AALYDGDTVTRESLMQQLPKELAERAPENNAAAPVAEAAATHPPLNSIQATERQALLRMLEDHRWNVSNVAKALSLSRNTLYRKLHRLHIELSSSKRLD